MAETAKILSPRAQVVVPDRGSGCTLADSITGNPVRYQASVTNPGQLEQIAINGRVTVGLFINGEFIPSKERR